MVTSLCTGVSITAGYIPRNAGKSATFENILFDVITVSSKNIFLPTIYECFYFPTLLIALDKIIFSICHFSFCKFLTFFLFILGAWRTKEEFLPS